MRLEGAVLAVNGANFPVVCIGASSGATASLSHFFHDLPGDLPAAFIVVSHPPRHRDSISPDALARCTPMKVAMAVHGGPIEAGHVYLNGPDTIITVSERTLLLTQFGGERNPIDITLTSLAAVMPGRTIAVILAGTGTDGALGVTSVRQAGGLTMAQRQSDKSEQGETTDQAAAVGFVDAALPIEALSGRLADFIAGIGAAPGARRPAATAPGLSRRMLADIQALLCQAAGQDWQACQTAAFACRVKRRMQLLRIADPTAYMDVLRADRDEAGQLCRELLSAPAGFFHDAQSHMSLMAYAMPHLAHGHTPGEAVRVWVPGCSTGEAAYAIAMLLREQDGSAPARLQIFATDADENVLAIARAGRYPAVRLAALPLHRLARFFVAEGASYVVGREIRDACLFARHSITNDPPFSRLDLIACHGLPSHFDASAQARVAALFHYALRPGGYLFAGANGLAARHPQLFAALDDKSCIFQRREAPARTARPARLALPARPAGLAGPAAQAPASTMREPVPVQQLASMHSSTLPAAVAHAQAMVLDSYAPAHIVVDQAWQVVHFSVRTGAYLESPYGAPNRGVVAMARPGLGQAMSAMLREAAATGRTARRGDVLVQARDGARMVDLSVEKLHSGTAPDFWLIVFSDAQPGPAPGPALSGAGPDSIDPLVWRLQTELADTRQELRAAVEQAELSIEELRAANEDMASVNEELQSGNTELETSQEELQALNEELKAVNDELTAKVVELDHATSDIRNLLDSTRIATLFLNDRLELRVFTPAASVIFHLTRADCGRSILDLASTLDYGDLVADVAATLANRAPLERRVATRDRSANFLMRLLPYRKADDSVDGVVLTFVDITSLVELGEQRALVAELNHRVKNVLAVVMSVAGQLARRSTGIEGFTAALADRINGLAKTHDILSRNKWVSVDLLELVTGELHAFVSDPARLAIRGPAVQLPARAVTALGCVIHELATNATKYGALAAAHGDLKITWSVRERHNAAWVVLVWRETGGPATGKPERVGFGTELTKRTLEYEFEGSAKFDYRPTGLVVTLAMPMRHLRHAA